MNKFTKAIAAIMLMIAVVCAVGCKKTDDPINGGNDNDGGNGGNNVSNGLFSVSATQQVRFSQGNLQYQASTRTWRFAENQWDYVGEANSNISSTYDGWIDLFAWGTSGWNCNNTFYEPWDNYYSSDGGNLYGPPGLYDLTGDYANSDWGVYNAISNASGLWRTMTQSEWNYVLNLRNTPSGIRYAKARVNNVNGLILLPDDWKASYYSLNNTNASIASFSSNLISISSWTNLLQAHGAVFLPTAGRGSYGYGIQGDYWSTSCGNSKSAVRLCFEDSDLFIGDTYRFEHCSVRLISPTR